MNCQRVSKYTDYGCNFEGDLVVVNYFEEAQAYSKWGTFGGNLTFDYLEKAKALVAEQYGDKINVLLAVPEYVCEVID